MRIGYFLSTRGVLARASSWRRRRRPRRPVSRLCGSATTSIRGTTSRAHSPFVWSVIGAISQDCDLPVTTAVTCPTVRIHPAIIAQAAATSAVLLEGRFTLGVGSGEALNEHILGEPWPLARRTSRDARGGGRR